MGLAALLAFHSACSARRMERMTVDGMRRRQSLNDRHVMFKTYDGTFFAFLALLLCVCVLAAVAIKGVDSVRNLEQSLFGAGGLASLPALLQQLFSGDETAMDDSSLEGNREMNLHYEAGIDTSPGTVSSVSLVSGCGGDGESFIASTLRNPLVRECAEAFRDIMEAVMTTGLSGLSIEGVTVE